MRRVKATAVAEARETVEARASEAARRLMQDGRGRRLRSSGHLRHNFSGRSLVHSRNSRGRSLNFSVRSLTPDGRKGSNSDRSRR